MSVTIAGRPRTFAPAPWICCLLAAVLPLAAAWYLAATFYVVFHDQLLASLIARQTDMQYAYEDRIAGLRTQLDSETSRGLVDRHMLETSVHDLETRSATLEQRAVLIDRLLTRTNPAAGSLETIVSRTPNPPTETSAAAPSPLVTSLGNGAKPRLQAAGRNPLLMPNGAGPLSTDTRAYAEPEGPAVRPAPLRLDGYSDNPAPNPSPAVPRSDTHAAVETTGQSLAEVGDSVAASLSGVERAQVRALATLRDPALRSIARLRNALRDVGVSVDPATTSSDIGGPYVPLPAGVLSFDENAALVQDAFLQADRLTALAAKVPLRKPLAGPLDVTSSFGPRLDPFLGRPAMHTGIDFRETYGDEVHATAAGTVTIAGSDGGYGTMVEIDHGNGLATRYAHLSSVSVSPNQKVGAGELVGHVGATGRATGPHLHYETRINGEPVDPTRFLRAGAKIFD